MTRGDESQFRESLGERRTLTLGRLESDRIDLKKLDVDPPWRGLYNSPLC
jgi:hypothetical protein